MLWLKLIHVSKGAIGEGIDEHVLTYINKSTDW